MTATSHSFLAGCRGGADDGIAEFPVRQRALAIGPWFCRRLILLALFIRRIIRLRSEKLIPSVPLRAEQSIEFTEAGRVVLAVEGPLFTRRFARTEFELRGGRRPAAQGPHNLVSRALVHFLADQDGDGEL